MVRLWQVHFLWLCLLGSFALSTLAQEWPSKDENTELGTDFTSLIQTKEEPTPNDSSGASVVEPPDHMAVGAPPGPGVETSKKRRLQAEQEAEDKERQDAIDAARKEEELKKMLEFRRQRENENWHKRSAGLTDKQVAERDGLTGHSDEDPDPSDLTDGWYNGKYLGEEGAAEAASEEKNLAAVQAQEAAQKALVEKAQKEAEIKAHNEWENEQEKKLKEEHAEMEVRRRLEKEQDLAEAQKEARQKYLERRARQEKARAVEEAKRKAVEERDGLGGGVGRESGATDEENSLVGGWVNGQPVDPSQLGQVGEMTQAQQEAAAKKAALTAAAAKKADMEAEMDRKLKAEAMNKKLTPATEDAEAIKKRKADENFAKLQQETARKAAEQKARDARRSKLANQHAQKPGEADTGEQGGSDLSSEDEKALLGGWVNGQLMDPSQAQQVGEMTMKQQEEEAKRAALAAAAAKKADQEEEMKRKLKAESMNKPVKTAEQLSKEAEKKKLNEAFAKLQEDTKKKSDMRRAQHLAAQKKQQEEAAAATAAAAAAQGSTASASGLSSKDEESMVGGWVNGQPVGAEGAEQAGALSAKQQAAVNKLAAQAQAQAKEDSKQAELRRKEISELMNENLKKGRDAANAKIEEQKKAKQLQDQQNKAQEQKLQELLRQQQASLDAQNAHKQQLSQQSLTQQQMAMQNKLMQQQQALAGINAMNQRAYGSMLYGPGGMYGRNNPYITGLGVSHGMPNFDYLYNSLNVPNPGDTRWQPKQLPQRTWHAAYGHGSNFMTGVANPMNAGGLNNAYIPPASPSPMKPGVSYGMPNFDYLYNSLNVPNPGDTRWQSKQLPQRTWHAAYGHGSNFMTGVANPMNAGGLNNAYTPPASPSLMSPMVNMAAPTFSSLYSSLNVPNPMSNRWEPKVVEQRVPHATYGQQGNFLVGTNAYGSSQHNIGAQSQLEYQPPSMNLGDSNPNFDTISDGKGDLTSGAVPQGIVRSVSGVDRDMVDPYAQ